MSSRQAQELVRYGLPFFVAVALLYASFAHAQFILPGVENALSISTTPAHPAPGDSVHLEARSALYDLSQSALTWRVNGKTFTAGEGVTSADIVAGSLGSEIDVSVDAVALDGAESFAEIAIIPTEVDLLFDSDSYVPPFYRGRALPSAGTHLHLEALPHLRVQGGKDLPASELTYTWRRNDEVLGSVSGKGKSSVTIAAPVLFATDVISVEVRSSNGVLSGEAQVQIPSLEPTLALYEDHPLYGILYNRALGAHTDIPDTEMTFAAIPYFAQSSGAQDHSLQYAWMVNETAIKADSTRPNELTINATNSNGEAELALELTHLTNVFLQAAGSWGITLSSRSGSNDAFHSGAQ